MVTSPVLKILAGYSMLVVKYIGNEGTVRKVGTFLDTAPQPIRWSIFASCFLIILSAVFFGLQYFYAPTVPDVTTAVTVPVSTSPLPSGPNQVMSAGDHQMSTGGGSSVPAHAAVKTPPPVSPAPTEVITPPKVMSPTVEQSVSTQPVTTPTVTVVSSTQCYVAQYKTVILHGRIITTNIPIGYGWYTTTTYSDGSTKVIPPATNTTSSQQVTLPPISERCADNNPPVNQMISPSL